MNRQHTPEMGHFAESDWEQLQRTYFPLSRYNLNPGTLGTPSRTIHNTVQEQIHGVKGYPLGLYQAGREALKQSRALAHKIWPTTTHDLAIGPPMTTAANVWTHAFSSHWHSKSSIKVLSTHHEHYGCLSSFANHPRYEIAYLTEAEIQSEAAFCKRVQQEAPDLAIFSHITYNCGDVFPVGAWDAILQTHQPNCVIVLDIAHSIGQCPLPFPAGDILLGSTHKWLCGPWELGFTWLRQSRRHLLPELFLTDSPLDSETTTGGYELSGGQHFAKYIHLQQTLTLLWDLGPDVIYKRTQALASYFAKGCLKLLTEKPLITLEETTSSMLLLRFHGVDPYPVYRQLNDQSVHVKCIKGDYGPTHTLNLLRIGIPFYETKQRLDRTLEIFAQALSTVE